MTRLSLACLSLLALAGLTGCGGERSAILGYVASEPGPAIASVLAEQFEGDITLSLVAHDSPESLLLALQAGEVDLAIAEHPSTPIGSVGVLSSLYPSVLHLITRQDALCNTHDPASQRLRAAVTNVPVYAGPEGSAGYRLLMDLAAVGLVDEPTRLQLLANAFGEMPQTFVEFGGVLPIDATRRLDGYCLLSLGTADEAAPFADALALRFPHLEAFTIPAGLYPALAQDAVQTLAVRKLLIARMDLDVDLAYDIAAGVASSASALGEVYPLARAGVFAELKPAQLNLPVLPGAQRFLDRDAPGFLERHAETLALLITAIVALSSAGVALLSRYRQSRKDRLDRYFEQLVALQSEAATASSSRARELLGQLDAQTEEVVGLLMEERVAADPALVAYLQLGDRVRQALAARAS